MAFVCHECRIDKRYRKLGCFHVVSEWIMRTPLEPAPPRQFTQKQYGSDTNLPPRCCARGSPRQQNRNTSRKNYIEKAYIFNPFSKREVTLEQILAAEYIQRAYRRKKVWERRYEIPCASDRVRLGRRISVFHIIYWTRFMCSLPSLTFVNEIESVFHSYKG